MICLICLQADVVDGLTSISLERGEIHLVVKNVPAWVCPKCGEAFLNEDIATQLMGGAQRLSAAGLIETEFAFSRIESMVKSF